jgi:hypothetical protein
MPNEELLMKWIGLIKGVTNKAPEHARSSLIFPENVLPLDVVISLMNENHFEEENAPQEAVSRGRASSMFGGMLATPRTDDGTEVRKSIFGRFVFRSNNQQQSDGSTPPDTEGGSETQRGRADSRARTNSIFGGRSSLRMSMGFMSLTSKPEIEEDSTPEIVNGFLYYKHNSKVKRQFSQYWFSLRGFKLYYYKEKVRNGASGAVNNQNNNRPLDFIDLLEVLEVKEATEAGAPENSFDLVTPSRTYKLTASDEDQCLKWLDALSETLEVRKVTVQQDESAKRNASLSTAERINALKKTIVYQGGLTMKTSNRLTSFVSWKPKYFVISKGLLI